MKKHFSIVLIMAMLLMSVVSVASAANTDYIWIEAEDSSKVTFTGGEYETGYRVQDGETYDGAASGGAFLQLGNVVFEEGSNFDVEFSFAPTADGKYDIWVLALDTTSEWWINNPYTYSLNGSEAVAVTAAQTTEVSPYSAQVYTLRKPVKWIKLYSGTDLKAEENKLKLSIGVSKLSGVWLGAVDCMTVVPSGWGWSPNAENPYANPQKTARFFADNNGVIMMEAESANLGSGCSVMENRRDVSGNKYVRVEENDSNAEKSYDVEFLFDIKTKQPYDVWVLAHSPAVNPLVPWQYSINGAEKASMAMGQTGIDNITSDNFASGFDVLGTQFKMYWQRVAEGEIFENGVNSLCLTCPGSKLPGYYLGAVDCAMVVPSSKNWICTNDYAVPEASPQGYSWINLANPDNGSRFTKIALDAANDSVLWVAHDESLGGETEILKYNFELANSGSYDIWYLGTSTKTGYMSRLWWGIDETNVFTSENDQTKQLLSSVDSPKVYSDNGQNIFWQKMASGRDIDEGQHYLDLEFVACQAFRDRHYFIADTVVIVPSEWEWTPSETENTPAVNAAVYLDTCEVTMMYAGQSVENNLILPIAGSAGGRYTYTSLTPEVVTDNGVITRPPFNQQDETGVINVTAKKKTVVSDEQQIFFTVLNEDLYSVDKFEINGDVVSGGRVSADAVIRVNDSQNKYGAVLILAELDSKGAVVNSVFAENNEIGTENTELKTAEIVLSDNVEGHKVRAFLWDGWSKLIPIADVEEK